MPTPGLTDIYEFSDWLKKSYMGDKRSVIQIVPMPGGLIYVTGHDTPRSADPEREARGTFACPICGVDSPHEHSGAEIQAFRVKSKLPEPSAETRTFFSAPLGEALDAYVTPAEISETARELAAVARRTDAEVESRVTQAKLRAAIQSDIQVSHMLVSPELAAKVEFKDYANYSGVKIGDLRAELAAISTAAAASEGQVPKDISQVRMVMVKAGKLDVDCIRCFEAHPDATPFNRPFIVCPTCGNKRCPKATFHELVCTNSNEPGQAGSDYA